MLQGTVCIRVLVEATFWIIGGVLAILDATTTRLGALSLFFVVVAATMHMRACVERLFGAWVTAYEAGREVSTLRPKSGSR